MTQTQIKPNYIIIGGPTASGKTSTAYTLAKTLGAAIINGDSVQLYNGFNIGSAKDPKVHSEPELHHLFDITDWRNEWDASRYAQEARKKIQDINANNQLAIVVGGTGLYLRALMGENFHDLPFSPEIRAEIEKGNRADLYAKLQKVDPTRAKDLHPNDKLRIVRALEVFEISGKPMSSFTAKSHREFPPLAYFSLIPERSLLHTRIEARTKVMLQEGLIDEVKTLLDDGCPRDVMPMRSIGYQQATLFIDKKLEEAELIDKIIAATRQYAKRQCTWFSKVKDSQIITDPEPKIATQKILQILETLGEHRC